MQSILLNINCHSHCPLQPSDPKECSAKAKAKAVHLSSKDTQGPESAAKMPAQGEIKHCESTASESPLSRQPGCIDVRLKEDGSLEFDDAKDIKGAVREIPLSRQPGSMDVRLKDAVSPPKAPALSRPNSREPTPRRATSAEAPPSCRPRSLEGKPKGVNTPELLAAHRPGSMEANPRHGLLPEAVVSSRPATKGIHASEVRKTPTGLDEDQNESTPSEGSLRSSSCLEEPSG